MNKSLFKRPGTKHFQLVHRSQRDPLINDPDASDRVFKEIDKTTGAERPGPSSTSADFSADPDAVGDAASYGIYFNDTEYNYMQHLRQVGLNHDSFLVEAPAAQSSSKGKGKARGDGFEMKDAPGLPEAVLPSHPLDEISYTDATTNAAPVLGLQPDLDPKIREILEALDDEAYAADDGTGTDEEDEFWKEVTHGGEVREGEEEDNFWENEEDEEVDSGVEDDGVEGVREGVAGLGANGWADVAKFKAATKAQAAAAASDDEDDYGSEGGDTIAELRASSAKRPARGKPTKGSVAGSQFSMTSSAMFRNEQLRTLDDRFDQIEKLYEDDSDDSGWSGDDYDEEELAARKAPREDLEQIMDDFLSRFEVLGGKMKHVLEPAGSNDQSDQLGKLDRIRRELASLDLGDEVAGEDPETTARRLEKEKILAIVARQERDASRRKRVDFPQMAYEKPKERWDCETVLSTYSNVSNHPRLLRVRDLTRGPKPAKIAIDPKTGFPMVDGEVVGAPAKRSKAEEEDEEMDDEESEGEEVRETVTRPRGESAEDKKARKAAVKAERAARRTEKKSTKEAFGNEVKRQKRIAGKAVAGGAAADVRVGEGVRRLA